MRRLRVHGLEEKIETFSSSHGNVVVNVECFLPRCSGSTAAREISAFKFFPERKKRVR